MKLKHLLITDSFDIFCYTCNLHGIHWLLASGVWNVLIFEYSGFVLAGRQNLDQTTNRKKFGISIH